MLSPKRLVEKAKRGIPLMRSASSSGSVDCTTVVAKGHFVVYTVDEARFMVPVAFLESSILQELLKMSEEEFGLPGNGLITVACTAVFMEYILSLLQRHISRDMERALLASIDANRCLASSLSLCCSNQHQLAASI